MTPLPTTQEDIERFVHKILPSFISGSLAPNELTFPSIKNYFEVLLSERDNYKRDAEAMKDTLEYVYESCLCERFKTKGFDYGQKHETMGKAGAGERWITPCDKVSSTLSSLSANYPSTHE